jgi:hypothetical protein
MSFTTKEFGGSIGAILVTPSINSGVYDAPSGFHIYDFVPDPTAAVIAIPTGDTTNYISSNRASNGTAVTTLSGFKGQYSRVTVSSGQAFVYIRKNTAEI